MLFKGETGKHEPIPGNSPWDLNRKDSSTAEPIPPAPGAPFTPRNTPDGVEQCGNQAAAVALMTAYLPTAPKTSRTAQKFAS